MSSTGSIWAVVPVKQFAAAKRRLTPVLTGEERAQLARLMLEDVLDVLSSCRDQLAGIAVATSDADAAALAARRGAVAMFCPERNDINAAVRFAVAEIDPSGETGLLVVPSDIPQLTAGVIAAAAAAIAQPKSVAIAEAAHDGGTNLFACRPAHLLGTQFGPQSFARHCASAMAAGVVAANLQRAELRFDIDRPSDLAAFLSMRTATRTHAFLVAIGAGDRLSRATRRARAEAS